MLLQNIPVLRIFDVLKAKEFYIDWLGFTIGFEHQFDPKAPYYFGIYKDDVELHLSEHYGDGTPGSNVFIKCNGIEKYFEELQSRPYKYFKPSLINTFYNTKSINLKDPFGNMISFNEYL